MNTKKVLAEINGLIVEETLGAKGVDILKSLKDSVEELTAIEKGSRESLESLSAANKQLYLENETKSAKDADVIKALTEELNGFKKREQEIANHEFDMKLLVKERDCADLRRGDVFNLVNTIFKNPVVRRSVTSQNNKQEIMPDNGYVNTLLDTKTVDTTTSEE